MILLFLIFISSYVYTIDRSHLDFHNSKQTLKKAQEIIKSEKKGMYIRFGDGEIVIAKGQSKYNEKNSPALQREMQEAMGIQGSNVLRALPLNCREFGGLEAGMFPGNHEWPFDRCVDFLEKVHPFWKSEFTDVYSQTALHYLAAHNSNYCLRFLKFLREENCTVFVGNEHIKKEIRNLLFGENCKFVSVPSTNVYPHIDRIEKQCIEAINETPKGTYQVIVVALGVTGCALQKRLWQKFDNVFLLDFGSLIDALNGVNSRAWITLSKFDREAFLKRLKPSLRLLCTAALINNKFEFRKQEYIKSIGIAKDFLLEPYYVESCNLKGVSFLDEHVDHICYTKSNNYSLRNKGVNESVSVLKGLQFFDFDPEDMIIKLVGRHCFINDSFIKLIEDNPEYDVIAKKDPLGQLYSSCYAMKMKYLKDFLTTLDLHDMEKNMVNIERKLADYVTLIEKRNNASILYIDTLNVAANFFGTGTPSLEYI